MLINTKLINKPQSFQDKIVLDEIAKTGVDVAETPVVVFVKLNVDVTVDMREVLVKLTVEIVVVVGKTPTEVDDSIKVSEVVSGENELGSSDEVLLKVDEDEVLNEKDVSEDETVGNDSIDVDDVMEELEVLDEKDVAPGVVSDTEVEEEI